MAVASVMFDHEDERVRERRGTRQRSYDECQPNGRSGDDADMRRPESNNAADCAAVLAWWGGSEASSECTGAASQA